MPQPDALEQYERTDARALLRVMEAARPSHDLHAPPCFYAQVMQRVEQRQARRGFLAAWLPRLSPVWVPALSVGLLLSLGLNLWLGLETRGRHAAGPLQAASTIPDRLERDTRVHAQAFQTGMPGTTDLGTLVATYSAVGTPSSALGFADRAPRTLPFRVGTLYVEVLAYVQAGTLEAAVQQMRHIDTALGTLPLPQGLAQYLRAAEPFLATASSSPEALEAFCALFEPLYDDYTRSLGLEAMTLFRLGVWLENLLLMAMAKDTTALRQGDTAQAFQRAMHHLRAPGGVQETLSQLSALLAQPGMTDADVAQVLSLVQKLQRLLIG